MDSGNTGAELYDPATGAFTSVDFVVSNGCDYCGPAVGLADGKVLAAQDFGEAQLYDPVTNAFSLTGGWSIGGGSLTVSSAPPLCSRMPKSCSPAAVVRSVPVRAPDSTIQLLADSCRLAACLIRGRAIH